MSATKIPTLLDPARTDADWRQDLILCVDDEDTVEDWSGDGVSVALVRRGLPAVTYELTIGHGLLAPTPDLPVAIRVPELVMSGWTPGTYDGEVRRLRQDGSIDDTILFAVAIERGLSDLQSAAPAPPTVSINGGVRSQGDKPEMPGSMIGGVR